MKVINGTLTIKDIRLAIVVSRWNEFITKSLLEGAVEAFERLGGNRDKGITVINVPGALEIPVVAEHLAASKKFDGIIAIGAVIRGSTAHFEHVSSQASSGIAQIALKFGIPVGNAILTTENIEQAIERAGSKAGNKGAEALQSVVETINVIKALGD